MPKLAIANYREGPLYPRITQATHNILGREKVVMPVEVLSGMDLLTRKHPEDWRRGRTPYLERVIHGNLVRLSRVLRILRLHAHDLNLKPSLTVYVRLSHGLKQRLRFTKTGDPRLEEAHATRLVWLGKGPFPLAGSKEGSAR